MTPKYIAVKIMHPENTQWGIAKLADNGQYYVVTTQRFDSFEDVVNQITINSTRLNISKV